MTRQLPLPRWALFDVVNSGDAVFAPTPQGVGNEPGVVVAADESRSWVEASESLQYHNHISGHAAQGISCFVKASESVEMRRLEAADLDVLVARAIRA